MKRKELIFATTNPAKIVQVKGALALLPIEVKGVDPGTPLPKVIEDGETPLENAIIKAVSYAKALEQTVFSMDFQHISSREYMFEGYQQVRTDPLISKFLSITQI